MERYISFVNLFVSYFTRCFGTPHGTGEKEVKVKTTGRVVALAGRFIKCGFKPCGSTRITGSFRAAQTKAKYGKTTKIPGRKCFAHHQKGCDPSSEMPILAKSSQTPFLRLLKVPIIMSIDYNRLEVKGFQLESLELVVLSYWKWYGSLRTVGVLMRITIPIDVMAMSRQQASGCSKHAVVRQGAS